MPLSRTNRMDRRRRVMLDAVAVDSEYAVESVRAKKRLRTRELDDSSSDIAGPAAYRDPGYSQAVRRTCQQRMVQLIPVRRGTLSIVLTCMWLLWGSLLAAHYLIHVNVAEATAKNTSFLAKVHTLPVAQLFNLRSPHSIAHWLACLLWLLTALSAWMIFQLRRHKLDDYRARYRIWVVLAIASLFSSFDASSSGLYLLGLSIDDWTRREIGYGGWPLVLATFASMIGILGIRLCSELKSAPMSVACWLFGLLAWAGSALLGTGLMKTSLSPESLNLIVGSCWLGGILAVFQAAGIYLRQTYIHAQKRFLQRQGANLQPIRFRMPTMSMRRPATERMANKSDSDLENGTSRSRWKLPWPRQRDQTWEADEGDERTDSLPSKSKEQSRSTEKKAQERSPVQESKEAKSRGRLFGFIPNRTEQNERLEDEPILEDDGPLVDKGLTKKRGWFGIGGNRDSEAAENGIENASATSRSSESAKKNDSRSGNSAEADLTPSKKREGAFWSRSRSSSSAEEKSPENQVTKTRSKRNWLPKLGRSRTTTVAEVSSATKSVTVSVSQSKQSSTNSPSVDSGTQDKRSWMPFASQKSKSGSEVATKSASKPKESRSQEVASKPTKRGLFSIFDGLKLKPPSEEEESGQSSPTSKPVPIHQGQSLPSTRMDDDDPESEENYSGRPMSKAERKKQRRIQQDDRRAA